MQFVFRGRQCPRCKGYLKKPDALLDDWTALMDVVAVSADPEENAGADPAEFGRTFNLCHRLTAAQMRALGLYVPEPVPPHRRMRISRNRAPLPRGPAAR